MGQKAKSFKISHDLSEASVLAAKLRGHSSWGAYMKALIRKDIEPKCPHMFTKKLSLREEDQLDKMLRRKVVQAISPVLTE